MFYILQDTVKGFIIMHRSLGETLNIAKKLDKTNLVLSALIPVNKLETMTRAYYRLSEATTLDIKESFEARSQLTAMIKEEAKRLQIERAASNVPICKRSLLFLTGRYKQFYSPQQLTLKDYA